jgi:hypothetical protein
VNGRPDCRQDHDDPERDPPNVMYVNTMDLHLFLLLEEPENLYRRIPNYLKIKVMVTYEV